MKLKILDELKELKESLVNRDLIIKSIEEEIVGPGNIEYCEKAFNSSGNTVFTTFEESSVNYYWYYAAEKEEVLQKDSPSRRYAAGMLYPFNVKKEDTVEQVVEDVDGLISEDEDKIQDAEKESFYTSDTPKVDITEDDGLEEVVAGTIKPDDYMPSSIGITFCLNTSVQELDFKYTGGIYEAQKVTKDIKYDGKHYNNKETWWLRKSIIATKKINVSELTSKEQTMLPLILEIEDLDGNKLNKFSLTLHIQSRKKSDDLLLITATVINKTVMSNSGKLDEYTIFQSEITLTLENEGFTNYPKVFQRNIDLTEDEWNNELLFRKKANYAFGHGCSVLWEQHTDRVYELKSTFIPRYETESMTPDVTVVKDGKEEKLVIRMYELYAAKNYQEVEEILRPLIEGYDSWIKEREMESSKLEVQLQKAASKNLDFCRNSLERMKKGLELLQDEKTLQAFQLANKAILLQQINGKKSRTPQIVFNEERKILGLNFDLDYESAMSEMQTLHDKNNSWRAFQIAFFLLSIQSLVEKDSFDRKTVDLIWFPTGGGKTEAYLGVAAFQMFYRRLLNPADAGVDIMMRYTLRLLTADQFQRASRLMCAMEYIRRRNVKELGEIPYSIGIWVGSATSPNSNKDAITKKKLMTKSKGQETFVLTRCPWCGCKLGKVGLPSTSSKGRNNDATVLGFGERDNELITFCPDRACEFNEEIPVYFVDETIYEKKPTFLIGTIDKFVQLTWKPEARSLFGIGKTGERFISPPQIIIQDELHLISGPLGTLSGLYELLIEELCIDERSGNPIYPKIISATATIKEFEEQAKCLFGRTSAKLFPSPGIDIDDSYFAKVDVDERGKPMPGRKYVGVFTSRVKILMAQVMTYSAMLQRVEAFPENQRDPYWTLLSFYNSLRDLGAALNLFNSDIPTYIDSIFKREHLEKRRYLNMPLELTSRKQSSEITKTIDDLNIPYKENIKKGQMQALTGCLASNIIEVGVDIDRLSLMGIIGQPKMTAQYIQVSGRVGRRPKERPGLIVTIYSNQNSRDKSHYEHFNEYHQRLYAQVETTSLTPFSTASIERALSALIIGFIRQRLDYQLAKEPLQDELRKLNRSEVLLNFLRRTYARVELIDPEQLDTWKKTIKYFLSNLIQGGYETWGVSPDSRGLMYTAGKTIEGEKNPGSIPVINSLRSVDAESRGYITRIIRDEVEFDWGDI